MARVVFGIAAGFFVTLVALAQPAPDFEKQIAPILQSQCVICHGASAAQVGLRLHTKDAAMKSIVAGSPEASKLFRSIELPVGRAGAMPPGGPPVPAAQRELIRQWIAAGAAWPSTVILKEAKTAAKGKDDEALVAK